eukprot:UN09987
MTSKQYQANTEILVSFASTFDYSSPYENDDKYWAVTNIQFKMDAINLSGKDKKDEIIGMDIIAFIIIIVVAVCSLIVII